MFSLIKLPRVVTINQVPEEFHEDSIISGYRYPHSSAMDCILSLFQLTNETLNIWTHFLPTWYFLWKLVSVVLMQTVWQHYFIWPLVVLIISSCIYPLASTCAHTFNSMSPRARHMCFYFDYGALSLYSMGSAIAYSAYVFPDKWVNNILHQSFIPVSLLNSIICTSLACYSRFPECQRPGFTKALRIAAFAYPYLFDSIPLLYRATPFAPVMEYHKILEIIFARVEGCTWDEEVFLCEGDGCTDNDANVFHKIHIVLATLTGFLFATHLPERLAPGSFDYIGHSHQLFHVFGVLGTHFQIMAIECDMTSRRSWLLDHSLPITFGNSLGVTLLSLLANLTIVLLFCQPLVSTPVDQQKKHNS